ncbi:hypothetical protein [Streptomyces lydicamycinicus]|uniref:hypothetical protein n=1 Tax=Streptomyces lydicamycinicus TaxID=1546107 RepID=UPI003C2CA20C
MVEVHAGALLAAAKGLKFTDNFELSGIALGTLTVLTGYHSLRWLSSAAGRPRTPLLDAGTSEYGERGEGEG